MLCFALNVRMELGISCPKIERSPVNWMNDWKKSSLLWCHSSPFVSVETQIDIIFGWLEMYEMLFMWCGASEVECTRYEEGTIFTALDHPEFILLFSSFGLCLQLTSISQNFPKFSQLFISIMDFHLNSLLPDVCRFLQHFNAASNV